MHLGSLFFLFLGGLYSTMTDQWKIRHFEIVASNTMNHVFRNLRNVGDNIVYSRGKQNDVIEYKIACF